MINWERLYDVHRNNKRAGMAFEELAFLYLKKTYPQYHWDQTQGSWDGNKDFVSFLYEYIWGEAKYKKSSHSLKRQDIDTTFVSGLIAGKIHLIVFVTNATVPHTIADRVNQFSYHYDVSVIFIARVQLEYWLYNHPDIYEQYFQEKLAVDDDEIPALSIEYISFSDQKNENLKTPHQISEIEYGNLYVLNIVFESAIEQEVEITFQDQAPITFCESPNYNDPKNCKLSASIQSRKFLIKAEAEYCGGVTINVQLKNGVSLPYSFPLKCSYKFIPQLIYAEQNQAFHEIYQFIARRNTSENSYVMWLTGPDGSGKSFVLDRLLQEFFSVRDITKITFLSCSNLNHVLLCKIIMYLNFGIIGCYLTEDLEENSVTDLCHQLCHSQNQVMFDYDWIEGLVNGCLHVSDANVFIRRLEEEMGAGACLIHPQRTASSRILLCDDVHNLEMDQKNLLQAILDQSARDSNAVIILSSLMADSQLYHTQNSWRLDELTEDDIVGSIQTNLAINHVKISSHVVAKFPRKPILVSDIIAIIKHEIKSNKLLDIINFYNRICNEKKLFSIKFSAADCYYPLLDMIYLFPDGISIQALWDSGFSHEETDWAKNCEFCVCKNGKLSASHAIYRKAYLDFRDVDLYSDQLSRILWNLMMDSEKKYDFDDDAAYMILMKCDFDLYKQYSYEVQQRFQQLYLKGEYKSSVYYAEAYYEFVLREERELAEEDWKNLFYCGVSMMHCDHQHRGTQVFQYIYDRAPKMNIAHYMAAAELMNDRFWAFDGKKYEVQARHLESSLLAFMEEVEAKQPENLLDAHIALSTCQNRLMVMHLLKDKYPAAQKTIQNFYNAYLQLIQTEEAPKYISIWGEWLMDFARGMEYEDPKLAVACFENGVELINTEMNPRRAMLCELDLAVLKCLLGERNGGVLVQIERIEGKLKENHFYSEYFKSVIKKSFCEIYLNQEEILADPEFAQDFAGEVHDTIYEAMISADIDLEGRDEFLVLSLFSLLDLLEQDFPSARNEMERIQQLTSSCGSSYSRIIDHNLELLTMLEQSVNGESQSEPFAVQACFKEEADPRNYWIDPRIW